jgi:hypothetical protein
MWRTSKMQSLVSRWVLNPHDFEVFEKRSTSYNPNRSIATRPPPTNKYTHPHPAFCRLPLQLTTAQSYSTVPSRARHYGTGVTGLPQDHNSARTQTARCRAKHTKQKGHNVSYGISNCPSSFRWRCIFESTIKNEFILVEKSQR